MFKKFIQGAFSAVLAILILWIIGGLSIGVGYVSYLITGVPIVGQLVFTSVFVIVIVGVITSVFD